MKHLFVYGSLMFEPVWKKLVKPSNTKQCAVLCAYQALVVRGETYPGLVANAESETQGVLVLNVNDRDLQRLDRFEGKYYQRISVTVKSHGKNYPAQVYIFKQRYKFLLSSKLWDAGKFKKHGLKLFLRRYGGF